LTHVDLRAVARLPVLVLPLAILDPSLDVDLVALLDVALDDVGELRRLRIPHDAAVPLRLLLTHARLVVPRPAGREGELRHAIAAGSRAHLRIASEIPDQRHLVQAPAHGALLQAK